MAVGAAATAREIGAVRRDAVRRGREHLEHLGKGDGAEHLEDQNAADLAAQRPGHKDDKALDAGDTRSLTRIALNGDGILLIFHDRHSVFPQKRARSTAPFPLFVFVDEREDLAGKGDDILIRHPLALTDQLKQRLARGKELAIEVVRAAGLHRALALGDVALIEHHIGGEVVALGKLRRVGREAECAQLVGKSGRNILIAVDDEHARWLGVKGLDPLYEVVVIGVGGKALEVHDLRPDRDLLAEELHALHTVEQSAPERAGRLEADEHHCAVSAPEVVLEMVADAPRVAHTGGGNDDLGRFVEVEHSGFLGRLDQVQVREGEHVCAVLHQLERVLVKIAAQVSAEYGGRRLGEGRVDIDRKIGHGLHQSPVLDLADKVQKLLRAADGEGRNDDVAALGERFVDDLRQLVGVAPHLGVVAVAVGGLHHHIVRLLQKLRVADDGLVDIADVTGEDDRLMNAALRELQRDGGRAEQMPRIGKDCAHALAQLDALTVFADGEELKDIHRVLGGIERLNIIAPRALALAVAVLGVALLNMSGVEQHDAHEVGGHAGGQDASGKAALDHQGDTPRMVDVRMGDEQNVNVRGVEGEHGVVQLVTPLLQAAVHKDALAVDLKTMARAGDAAVRAVKMQFHRKALRYLSL